MARAHPHSHRTLGHSSDPNDIAAARRRGAPDPRTFVHLHQVANHAAAHDNIVDAVEDLNNLDPIQHSRIATRVEVIERLPRWQERLIQSEGNVYPLLGRRLSRPLSRWLSGLVLPRYRHNFSLVDYTYGRQPHDDHRLERYTIDRTLEGYVVPYPSTRVIPGIEPQRNPPLRGRHQDLVVSEDGRSSWAGSLQAYADPHVAPMYENTVGVGPDIDVLGLGDRSDHAIEEMASIAPGNVAARRTALLHDVAEKLVALEYEADPGLLP